MVRRIALAVACALLVTTAGCSGFLDDATVERDLSFRAGATVERPDWYETARNRTNT